MAAKMKSLSRRPASRKIARGDGMQIILFRRKTDLPWKESGSETLLRAKLPVEINNSQYRRNSDLERVKDLGDNELIVIIHTQNIEAYKELFARYQKKLFTYIYHLVGNRDETEDILQNVFSKTYKSIENFDTTRKFSSWIYRIAHNESVNFLKRKSKRYTISWDDISTSKDKMETATNDERPEEKMEHQEIVKEISWAMEKIPPKYQEVLRLRYFNEYSYEEMGKILGKPLNTVGTLINRAKKKLLEVVQEEEKKK
ncbi:MAG: RNA polymerase sigma factor [Parcubacteria group bacterium GW2011_GWD2_38_11]|nr:MAG: RNA polymerase sigma factor [Parcubacteria group bacterium GW2011_GWD2_38_11]